MSIEPHNASKEHPTDEIYLCLVGDYKAGKSRLASTAPGNKLFIDTDRRIQALAGITGVYGLSVSDESKSFMQPTAYNDILGIVEKLEHDRHLTQWFPDAPKDALVDWVVYDSVQTLAERTRAFILYTNKDLRREINIGGKLRIDVPYSFDGWSAEMSVVEQLLMRTRSIKGVNMIAVFHEVPEERPDSTQEKPLYSGKIEVYPRRYNGILKYFNEVWRVQRPFGPIPTVSVQPDGVFTKAATAFNLAGAQKPDIAQILRAARANISTSTVANQKQLT
jgi:hypothetical protein